MISCCNLFISKAFLEFDLDYRVNESLIFRTARATLRRISLSLELGTSMV